MRLNLMLLLLSARARAQAPIAAPLNIPRNLWTNFSWSKLHHGYCGVRKCYFPLNEQRLASPGASDRSSAATCERDCDAQAQEMGWLIEPHNHLGRPELSVWMRTWELAKDLHSRYGANHLLLGPPRRIALGNRDAALLNAHLTHAVRPQEQISERYAEGNALVQPVRSCPSPACLLMGCGHGNAKWKTFAQMLAGFLEQVHDKAKFEHALEQKIRSWNTMMRATTCLHADFQAFIRNDGQIFHVDLDRCYLTPPATFGFQQATLTNTTYGWADDCLDNAHAMIKTELNRQVVSPSREDLQWQPQP